MRNLINRILDYQIKNGKILEQEKEIYEYAYTILLEECINIVVAVIIGIIFEDISLVFISLFSYISLRIYAGGFHANNGVVCSIISGILIILLCVLDRIMGEKIIQLGEYIILLLAQLTIFVFAPVDSKNKKLDEYEIREYRKKTNRVLGFQILVILFSLLIKNGHLFRGIAYSHIVLGGMLLAGVYKNCQNKKGNTTVLQRYY